MFRTSENIRKKTEIMAISFYFFTNSNYYSRHKNTIKLSDRVHRLAARGRQSWPLIQNQSAAQHSVSTSIIRLFDQRQ